MVSFNPKSPNVSVLVVMEGSGVSILAILKVSFGGFLRMIVLETGAWLMESKTIFMGATSIGLGTRTSTLNSNCFLLG